ncbi:MAG TPA: hypothetical protein VNV43_08565 [Candidatus Acidoferrales bacterium]|jgi:hypothetical protein|nr:hypothetical protein [Candidatus Acidoferrales bacterium]
MNENDEPNVPNMSDAPPPITPIPNDEAAPALPPPLPNRPRRPLSWWLRKFFACNPFYLVSAALLLYGCYRVSIDETFADHETARLLFNFSSVQVYELLLVGVAIFLARRCLWYDSMVLVGLENMLVFVPFILISLAALTSPGLTVSVCAAAVILAALRFSGLRRYFAELNLPGSLLGVGSILLALNLALPLTYRHYINLKIGTHPDAGPDYIMNECMWLLVLPAALALANFLPRAQAGGDLLPQRRWLPTGLFALWITVTGLHLWALDYVYDYYLRQDLFAPVGWVLAWTVFLRAPAKPAALKYALMFPALAAPFLANTPESEKIYLALMALNAAAFAVVRFLRSNDRFAGHLAYASAVLFVAGLPENWIQWAIHGATATGCIAAGLAAYLIFWTAWLRNPKLALVGAILFGIVIAVVFDDHANVVNWALQGGFVFFLLHSLRWNDAEHAGAGAARNFIGIVWAIQSFVWMNCEDARFWMPFIPGMLVLAFYCVLNRGVWRLLAVPVSALAVALSGPCCLAIDRLRSLPVGLLAVMASFLLLGLGTVAALTRDLWHHHEHKRESFSSSSSSS